MKRQKDIKYRQGNKGREREREREADRQREREADRQRERETETESESERGIYTRGVVVYKTVTNIHAARSSRLYRFFTVYPYSPSPLPMYCQLFHVN